MDCGSEQGVQNEEIKMTKKYLEKYFSSVAVREIQIKNNFEMSSYCCQNGENQQNNC